MNQELSPAVKTLTCLVLCFASAGLADDFKTNDGKEYKNVTVSRVEPDGIMLITSVGISKVYFTELTKEVQEHFHYDAQKAAAYSAAQNAVFEQDRRQQEEATQQKAQRTEQINQLLRAQQSSDNRQQRIEALQLAVTELQQREDYLKLQLRKAQGGSYGRSGNRRYFVSNASTEQKESLYSQLRDVARLKREVEGDLKRAQRQK